MDAPYTDATVIRSMISRQSARVMAVARESSGAARELSIDSPPDCHERVRGNWHSGPMHISRPALKKASVARSLFFARNVLTEHTRVVLVRVKNTAVPRR